MTGPTSTTAAARRRPRGMTLVELLVVVALLLTFLGLVVTGVRGRRQQSQKRGGETLSAVLAAAQSRALGTPEGAAVILASGTGSESNAGAACTTVYDGGMLPLIQASVTGLPPDPPSATSASATVTPSNGDDVQRAYKILLQGDNPVAAPTAWLEFTPPGTVKFRETLGQTAANTVWPKATGLAALLAQYPSKSSSPVELDEGAAVDLSFSGIGDDRSTAYGRFDTNPDGTSKGSIAVVFDSVGRVAEVIQQVPEPGASATGAAQPAIPVGTIYFLIAPRELIVSGANTLASTDVTWVALSPQTGGLFVAENVPQSGTDTAALRAARAKARQGIAIGK